MLLHAATIALSAFLLFLVQPVIARQILPWFGGSAAVWTTCMVFFQVTLLAGYFYSDAMIRRVSARRQAIVHTALLLASLAFLPISPDASFKPVDADNPIGRILLLLVSTIGLPYLLLSTTGPLVQAWFAREHGGTARADQVWRLYALSNVASMLALVLYPPVIEPAATNAQQSLGWSAGYAAFVLLAIAAAWRALRRGAPGAGLHTLAGDAMTAPTAGGAPPSVAEQSLWVTLAALGSVLLLTVTTHITQNVASVPFLWVLPLAIYLVTFILCFDGKGWYWRPWYMGLATVLIVAMAGGLTFRPSDTGGIEEGLLHIEHAVPLYAFGLFVACMVCHGELVARKPAPAYLTRFYLMVSLGGAIGGLLTGIAAPLLLNYYWEFPAALVLLAALLTALATGHLRWLAGAAALATLALAVVFVVKVRDDVVELGRNFYGTLRVKATAPDSDPTARWRLMHGVIVHGEQFRAPQHRALPTTYYGETSGVGRAIMGLRAVSPKDTPQRIGLVGLGVGTLATYGRPGDVYRIYELNPDVLTLARRSFTYLADSHARIDTPLGDARLVMEREPDQRYDVLAVDAFSSDSIPVHLLTREAARLYRRHLAPGGVIAIHISNRYLDLRGVVRQLADNLGVTAVRIVDVPPDDNPLYRSDWVLLTDNRALLDALAAARIGEPVVAPAGLRPWTDDFNNLFAVLK